MATMGIMVNLVNLDKRGTEEVKALKGLKDFLDNQVLMAFLELLVQRDCRGEKVCKENTENKGTKELRVVRGYKETQVMMVGTVKRGPRDNTEFQERTVSREIADVKGPLESEDTEVKLESLGRWESLENLAKMEKTGLPEFLEELVSKEEEK